MMNSVDILDEFKDFPYKLDNRKKEFSIIGKYLPIPTDGYYKIFSLPFEYSFESEFYKMFKIPMIVYVGEKNYNIKSAIHFMNATDNLVMVPMKSYKNSYGPVRTVRVGSFIGSKVPQFSIAKDRYKKRERKMEAFPNDFDLIDLDYMTHFNLSNYKEAEIMYNNKLKSGGLLFLTFSLTSYRDYIQTQRKSMKLYDLSPKSKELSKFDQIKLMGTGKRLHPTTATHLAKLSDDSEKIKKINEYKNMAHNIVEIVKEFTGKPPIYINIYRGGNGISSNKVMLRIIFKK